MRGIGVPVPKFWKLFLIRLVGFSLSYVTPAALLGGEPARFYLLKSEDEKQNNRLIASIIVDKLMQILSSCFFFFTGVFVLLFYLNLSRLTGIIITTTFLFLIILFLFLIKSIKKVSKEEGFFISMFRVLYLNKIKKIKDMQNRFEQIEREMITFFRQPRIFILKPVLLTFVEVGLILTLFWLIIFFMGSVLTIPRLLVIRSMTDLSAMIPFPASLGTLEITQAFVFETFAMGAHTGVALSLIFRGVSLTLAFIGLIVFGFFHIQGVIDKFGKKILKLMPERK